MNDREAYKEEVGYGQGNAYIPLNNLVGFFSIMNIFFDHDREIVALRNLQKELNEHIARINAAKYSSMQFSAQIKQNISSFQEIIPSFPLQTSCFHLLGRMARFLEKYIRGVVIQRDASKKELDYSSILRDGIWKKEKWQEKSKLPPQVP